MTKYIIIGSGVIGLYTAYTLLEAGTLASDIKVIAQHLPGDESINYTSPYAGGNFSCITDDSADTLVYDKYTYTHLTEVQKQLGGPQCGVDRCESIEYFDDIPSQVKLDSLKAYLDNYSEISTSRLPRGVKFGIKFLSYSFNCPQFLKSLHGYLDKKGVEFQKKRVQSVDNFDSDTVVFNCTGIGAKVLVGDEKVYPTRGQVVVIEAPHISRNTMRWGEDYATYIIKRPFSHDQLILGGFMQKHNWTGDTFGQETKDILLRTTQLCPEILSKNPHGLRIEDLKVLRVVSGLRPSREGGVRIEREVQNGKTIVHNYGAGGYGYQAGLGMARRAVELASERESKL